jgi:hypothetical protein
MKSIHPRGFACGGEQAGTVEEFFLNGRGSGTRDFSALNLSR